MTGGNNTASGFEVLRANTTGDQNTGSGASALHSNTIGTYNTASGANSLYSNTEGTSNTASGYAALHYTTTGFDNTASGVQAPFGTTTGRSNAALGTRAGRDATTGSYNLFLGAELLGTAADTNTIRLGLPYNAGTGQNQTFIAGIRDTQLTGSVVPVYIDANGQLGTTPPPSPPGVVIPAVSPASSNHGLQDATVQQQLAEQRAINADLRARLARLEALWQLAQLGR